MTSSPPLWRDALNSQADLAEWWQSRTGKLYGKGFLRSLNNDERSGDQWRGDLATVERLRISLSPTYTITDEMLSVVESASLSLPDSALLPTDLPSRSGFLYLPRSLHFTDRNGHQVGFRVALWTTEHSSNYNGIILTLYSDSSDPMDYYYGRSEAARNIGSPLILLHITPMFFNETLEQVRLKLESDHRWQGRREVPSDEYNEVAIGSVLWTASFLRTFWAFCRDHADIEIQEPTDRNSRRRLQRSGIWGHEEIPRVRVVSLRRPRGRKTDGGSDVEYSHRWIVGESTGGFWRQQWFPTLGPATLDGKRNSDSHRFKWIFPFISGPEDKPLVRKHSVFKLER